MTNTDQADALKPCHELKTDPEVFDAMHRDEKNFEIRFNDRNYKVGDRLRLRRTQYSGVQMKQNPTLCPLLYTGEELLRSVAYILAGPAYGLESGWVIMAVQTTRAPEPEGEPVCIHCGEAENAHSAGGMLKCPEYHKGPFWTWRDTVFKAAPTAQPEAEPTDKPAWMLHDWSTPTAGSGEGEATFPTCGVCGQDASAHAAFFPHACPSNYVLGGVYSPQPTIAIQTAATSVAEQALSLERDRLKDAQEVAERAEQALREVRRELRIEHDACNAAGAWVGELKAKLAAAEQAKAQAEQERDAFKSERVNVLLMIAKDTMLGPYEGRETFYSRVADVVKAYKQAEQRAQAAEDRRDEAERIRSERGAQITLLEAELAEAREALRAALIPLAVLKMGQQTKPYAEHTATLTAEIAWAHDTVYAALLKAQEGKA